MQVTRARETLEAPLKMYQTLKGSMLMGAVFAAFFGVWQLYNLFTQLPATVRLKEVGQLGAYYQVLVFAAIGPAIATGMAIGSLGMARTFHKLVEPLMRARPPRAVGLAARCRSCGGDLPLIKAPQVSCRYCGATNMLDDGLTRDASRLLEAEIAHYRAQAQGAKLDAKAYERPTRAFYAWGIAGAAVTFAVLLVVLIAVV